MPTLAPGVVPHHRPTGRAGCRRSAVRGHRGPTLETYPAGSRQKPTLQAHLTYALRQEGVHLEFLARLFDVLPQEELAAWLNSERTGPYARRVGFLYEWLTGRQIAGVEAVTGGNYVDAIDPDAYLAATVPARIPRWRVRDNLPGNREFCPLVRRTPEVKEAQDYDCASGSTSLMRSSGATVLLVLDMTTWIP